ncbi:hypothetical protein [Duganella callida]|uniref:Uncharacterized protein n=1 Tax=Duganella callida TaxID=2561932 RepID=A0A4Y9SNZ1_9BURK|nr:hypothetical protein [Duganella callida]TFW28221.1 hypothetical protein E4L98_05815 [Duganella callida]
MRIDDFLQAGGVGDPVGVFLARHAEEFVQRLQAGVVVPLIDEVIDIPWNGGPLNAQFNKVRH